MSEEALFHEALAKPPADRAAFLDHACAGQPQLRAAVAALLAAHEGPESLLDRPAVDLDQTVGSDGHPLASDETTDRTAGPEAAWPHTFDTGPHAEGHATVAPGGVIAGRYALMERIGEGGMGEVWIALQTEPVKRKVALKLIRMGMNSRSMLARFEAERQALALMDHPNIARVFDGGLTPTGEPYFVMELVNGQTLTRFCDEAQLTTRQRLELFVPICLAVQHAHQKGIIHRDLKPGNVLVTLIDGKPVPKVIDFGVAKATDNPLTDSSVATQFGAVVGTLEYMSPEQAGYSGVDVDTRADIYSLGVILYELLTGLRPIDAKRLKHGAIAEVIRIIHEEEPSKPSTRLSTDGSLPSLAAMRQTEPKKLMASLRGELDWVVMKCLEKQRDRRYETANALARDIQRYLADEPVEARPPSAGYRLKKLLRRNRPAVFATALVAAALLVGTAVATWQAVRATRAEGEERAAKQQAEGLADDNAKLAADEREAKNKATQLAEDNAKLAANERSAKNQALDATREKDRQLNRARANLFTSQLTRVAALRETDPVQALDLLYDLGACPIDLRDAAWRFAERACNRRLVTALAHPADLLALSPDGKILAAARSALDPWTRTATGTVSLLDVSTGKVRAVLPGFPDAVTALAFSPDGKRLAVVAAGRPSPFDAEPRPDKVLVWDVAAAKEAFSLAGHEDRVMAVAFSPDGRALATGGLDNVVKLWDTQTGKERRSLTGHSLEVTAVAFSPDSKRLASGSLDNTLKLWQVEGGQLEATLKGTPNAALSTPQLPGFGQAPRGSVNGIVAVDFSPDGRTLAAGNTNWLIELWDIATHQSRSIIRGPSSPVRSLRFHPNGRSLLSSVGGTLQRWDAATGQLLFTLRRSSAMALNKDGSRLAHVVRPAGRIEILDLDAPLEQATLKLEKVTGTGPAVFGGAGAVLAVASGERVFLWDIRTGKLRSTLEGHKHPVRGLAVSPDGRTLATSSSFRGNPFGGRPKVPPARDDVRLWDILTGQAIGTIAVGEALVPSVAFSPDGRTLAAVIWREQPNGDKANTTVSLWDVKTRQPQATLGPQPVGGLTLLKEAVVAFSPDGRELAAGAGREITIWDVRARKVERRMTTGGMFAQVFSLAFSPNGDVLAVGVALADTVELWAPKTGELLGRLRVERDDGSIEVGGRPQIGIIGGAGSLALAFSPDGKSLASADARMIRLWDVETAQPRAAFPAHSQWTATALAFTPDGQTLASVTGPVAPAVKEGNGEVKLWDLGTAPALVVFAGQQATRFSPDGNTLAVRALPGDGEIHLWDLAHRRARAVIKTGPADDFCWAFSPDGRALATGGSGGTEQAQIMARMGQANEPGLVRLWDARTGASIRQFEVGRGLILAMDYSPDGHTLALVQGRRNEKTRRPASEVTLWSLAAARATATIPLPEASVRQVAFSPDGHTLALGSTDDGSILLRDLKTGKALPTLKDGPGPVTSVAFTTDGTRLVSRHARGAQVGRSVIWDWRAGKAVKETIPAYLQEGNVAPNGRYRLSSSPVGQQLIDRAWKAPNIVPRYPDQRGKEGGQ